jgi:RNA polymerase sigma-70 factor (ECF subfamily)
MQMVSDEQLMLDVRKGRREAFETLFERHRDAIWRFFRRRVVDAARCEELVQDVFVAVYQNAHRYEPRSTVRSYVFGIAFNTLHAERRRAAHRAKEPIADEPVVAPDPTAALWVREALASLDADAREIVMLREYEQLSYRDIAELLRLPLNTVRSRLFRARMDLKEALAGRSVSAHVARNFLPRRRIAGKHDHD